MSAPSETAPRFREEHTLPPTAYVPDRIPVVKDGVTIYRRALAVTAEYAENFWMARNEEMRKQNIDPFDAQVVVLRSPEGEDITHTFYNALVNNPLGRYLVATTEERNFPDGNFSIRVLNESRQAQSVYIVASLITDRDFSRVRRVANHYKSELNAKCVTLVCSFMGPSRGDKNVGKNGEYDGTTVDIQAEMHGLTNLIDRMIVEEPHSSATQAFAVESDIACISTSPWQPMLDRLRQIGVRIPSEEKRVSITAKNALIGRPDEGRNQAAEQAAAYLGLQSVAGTKTREGDSEVEINFSPADQALINRRIVVLFDDEASTMGTLKRLADLFEKYGALALAVCVVHGKFVERWEERMQSALLTTLLISDSRPPIGDIGKFPGKIIKMSLFPLFYEIINADMCGVNFWQDPYWKKMLLQEE